MAFFIVTDACSDLPGHYIAQQKDLIVVPMLYQADQDEQLLDLTDPACPQKTHAFFEKMRAGASTRTSQINQAIWEERLRPLLADGHDVLVLAFSGGLSSTAQSAHLACEALREQYQGRKIMAVDSLCASMGEGLFVHVVLKYRDEGHDIDACRDYAENIRQSIMHWFTVEDLVYLKRGGRISAASYFAATVLNIKPVLNVDPKGHLVSRNKVQGRKRSLRALYENVVKYADHPERQTMFIGHGDCLEDAEWLAKRLKEELHVPEIMIGYIGPVIGAHSGPGTLAVFFVDPTGAGRLEAE